MAEVLNFFQGNLFEHSIAPTISKRGFLELTLPHLQSSRGGSASGAQSAAVVKLLGILDKEKDEWAKNEGIQVQKYASIIKAAYDGEVEEVRSNLQRNREAIHERTNGGRNALHAACTNGHLKIVQLLVEETSIINEEDATGITPLRMAVASNHIEVTKYLISQQAEPNIADHTGWTPLHSAALNGHANIIKLLKTSGADVTKQTERGYSALFLASLNGQVDCVVALLETEAGTNELEAERCRYQLVLVDDAGFSALHCAAMKGHAEITNILLRMGASPARKSVSGMVPLTLAAAEGHISCVRVLLRLTHEDDASEATIMSATRGHTHIFKYATLIVDFKEWSLQQCAAITGDTESIREMIEEGCDIDENAGKFGNTPLLLAIWTDHLECATFLIKEGNANVNKPDNSGWSPLHVAVKLQNEEVMTVLLENGAQPDAINNEGKAAIHDACFKGDLNAIKLLINAGADVDIKVSTEDISFRTPLQFAALGGHIECVKLLLVAGAHIETPGPENCSALSAAAYRNQVDVIKYLLGQDANIDVIDNKGDSVLFWAALNNNIDLLNKCFQDGQIDKNAQNSSGQTALHVASGFGHIEAVKLLVQNHAEIELKDNEESTPLQNAAECNRAEVIKYLLENGADIQTKNYVGQSPLHLAVSEGSIDSVKMLLKMGADTGAKTGGQSTTPHRAARDGHAEILRVVTCQSRSSYYGQIDEESRARLESFNKYQWTPLEIAIDTFKVECVRLLCDYGANLEAHSVGGKTPLYRAVEVKSVEIVKLLLEKGVNINTGATLRGNETPLHLAVTNEYTDIVQLLIEHGADSTVGITTNDYNVFHIASVTGQEECLQILVRSVKGIDDGEGDAVQGLDRRLVLDSTLKNKMTPLHCAIHGGHLGCVHILCDAGANVEAQLMNGRTPLQQATVKKHVGIMKCLLAFHADVNKTDNTGTTALHIAASNGIAEPLGILLESNADVNAQSKGGWTPLHMSVLSGHVEITSILIAYGSNIHAEIENGNAPIHIASERNRPEILQCLIENAVSVDTTNKIGNTALMLASSKRHPVCVDLLLQYGAEVNKQSMHNSTPLLIAAEHGNQSCLEKLIAHGADPTKRDNDGDSLVHVAAIGGRLETLEYVLDLEGMSELISSKNNAGHSPLHCAARKGNLDCVELLLALEVSQEEGEESCSLMDEQDSQGKTPLHLAVEGGFSPVIEALIEAGANLNIQTNEGKTCLHLVVTLWGFPENPDKSVQTTNGFEAVSSGYPEYEPLTENQKLLLYLLDKGAICTTFDASGNTPIHYTNSHRLWQLIVSRITIEERSDLLSALALESENIKRTVNKTIGPDGGEIDLNRYGVHMTIPAGALDDDQEIIMKLLGSLPESAIQEGEMLASFGVQLNPCGLKFNKPVQIRLPHCAKIPSTSPIKMVLYHYRDGEVTKTDMVSHDLRDTPAVVVQERDFVLYIGEFCNLFALFKNHFFGKDVRCFISSKPSPDSKHHNLKITLADDIPNEQNQSTNGYEKISMPSGTPFYVQWNIAAVSIALFDNKAEKGIEEVTENEIFRRTQNEINFLKIETDSCTNLQVRLFHGKRKNIPCFTPGAVETKQPTSKPSHVHTPTEESREQDFDDQLKTVAKKIHKTDDIEESREQDFDDHLKTVAKKIHKADDIDSLAKELGFEPHEIARYLQTNTKYQTVTHMGTVSMLRDWRNRTKRSEEWNTLKKALIAINHLRLAEDLLHDFNANEESPDRP